MKLRNITCFFCVCMLMFASCHDDREDTNSINKTKANFTAGISTRAVDARWDVNDAIGLSMIDESESRILEDVYNRSYYTTTPSGDFLPSSSADIIYFPQNGDRVLFKAYYPYRSTIQRDLRIPISVANQSNLPAIDFMSAEHLSGFTKEEPNVSLRFHHRLSKMEFQLTVADGVELPLEDITLTVKGMKTSGVYDLFSETLIVDEESTADITIPRLNSASGREGIVLPRPAGIGVTFDLASAGGSNFSADMGDELALEPGYKYIFHINLEGTEISVSVTIEDWIEGPTTSYDVLGITTPVEESVNVLPGDQMQVYVKQGNEYEDLRIFTYGEDGRWTTPSPVFWEDIHVDPLDLRAALIPREPARNETQLPDIILAEEVSVERNSGANFTFTHVASRVKVVLQSNVFTQEQLDAAPIILPSYFVGGQEQLGLFIPGTTRDNIVIDKTNLDDQFAIIQPQSVSPEGALVRITLDGREFTARATEDGFLYEAGVSYELIIMVNESDISVSARVIDWTPSGPHNFSILEVTPSLEDTDGVEVGARMTVYKNDNNVYDPWTTFTYAGGNIWRPDTEVYWEQVVGEYADLRASIIAQTKLDQSQIDDILIANDIRVPVNTGADFVLRHVGSRAVVGLVSDTFSEADLNGATIIMPQYTTGGYEERGQFIPGQASQDITLVRDEATNNGIAIIQPQTIPAGSNIFRIRIGTRDYWAQAPEGGFTYAQGVSYAITIHVNEENLTVSAQVIPWNQTSIDLNAFTIGTTLPGPSSGIADRTQMNVYMAQGADRNLLSTFTYSEAADSWTSSPTIFWEQLPTPVPAFYASILVASKLDPTQLDDYLVADVESRVEGQPVNFTLRHPASKVTIQLRSSDNTFSPSELAQMVITLPDYITGGEHNNGIFEYPLDNPTGTINVPIINNNATAIIRPQTVVSRPVVNIYDPQIARNYPVTSATNIEFRAGEATILNIDMKKTAIGISANAIDWTPGTTIPLVAPSVEIIGTLDQTSAFFQDKTIYTYRLGSDFRNLVFHYEPNGSGGYVWRGTQTLYWDDLNGQPLTVTGVYYPQQSNIPDLSQAHTTFPWNLPADQTAGYDDYDLLMSSLSIPSPAPVNFDFAHVMSRVRVRINAPEFTTQELEGMSLTLNNFIIDGSASLTTGEATGTTTRKDVIPYTDVQNQEYSALVMPQTIPLNTPVVTITLSEYQNTPFVGTIDRNLNFVAGKENVITVTLRKTAIEISATLEDWTSGPTGSVTIQ